MPEDVDKVWITPASPVYILCDKASEYPGLDNRGLLWGRGNPNRAGLFADGPWMVARASRYYEIRFEPPRWQRNKPPDETVVGFREHEIVMEGTRRAALEALISLGAQAESLSTPLEVAERNGVAKTANWGTSIAGDFGIAKSGEVGHSEAGANGIALAGSDGRAYAGEGGIAVLDAEDGYSIATAGTGGIAIGIGMSSMKHITAGDGGIAVCQGPGGGVCQAGDRGIAVGGDIAKGGAESIVVGEKVSGGPGSLLISRHYDFETGAREFATGMVGQNGIEPNVRYIARNGALERA